MNIGRATEHRNTSQLFINLLKIVGVGSGAPEKIFDVVLRNVELLCILDSGAGRQTIYISGRHKKIMFQAVGGP